MGTVADGKEVAVSQEGQGVEAPGGLEEQEASGVEEDAALEVGEAGVRGSRLLT